MTEDKLTIRIDKKTKQELMLFADSIGLNASRMIRVLVKQALRERRILILNKDPAAEMRKYIEKTNLNEDLD